MELADAKAADRSARDFVHRLNQSWLTRNFRELAKYLHDEIVIVSPDTGRKVTGKRACVRSYQQFMISSKVHEYKESSFTIDNWGSASVVAYKFRIKYEWNGRRSTDTGRDIFILVREREKWKVVWRTLIPDRV